MDELLNSIHGKTVDTSWQKEIAEASASFEAEPAKAAPEPVAQPAVDPEPVAAESEAEAVAPAHEPARADAEDDRRVPLKALQEERQKRSEMERRLNQLEQMLNNPQRQQAEPEAQEEIPDPETDPIGTIRWMKAQQERSIQAEQERSYEAHLDRVASHAAQTFARETPDYNDAYRYALNSRAQELMAIGTPQEHIGPILQREERQLIHTAIQNGKSPAEAIYHFAKARGHRTAEAAAPKAEPVVTETTPNAELQNIKKAVAASVQGGKPPKGELTAADLANMTGPAFDGGWQKVFKPNKSSLFRD